MDNESFFYFQIAEGVVDNEPQQPPQDLPTQKEHWCKEYLFIKASTLEEAQVKAENMALTLNEGLS